MALPYSFLPSGFFFGFRLTWHTLHLYFFFTSSVNSGLAFSRYFASQCFLKTGIAETGAIKNSSVRHADKATIRFIKLSLAKGIRVSRSAAISTPGQAISAGYCGRPAVTVRRR